MGGGRPRRGRHKGGRRHAASAAAAAGRLQPMNSSNSRQVGGLFPLVSLASKIAGSKKARQKVLKQLVPSYMNWG